MTSTDFIATLALVIAAATFALQVKQWFDSGPKLHLSIIADAVEFPHGDGIPKLALTVTNRGSERTEITHMVAFAYSSRWNRFRRKPYFTAIVKSAFVPAPLEPKKYWMGFMNYDNQSTALRMKQEFYVGIYATHSDKEFLIRVPLPRKKLAATENAGRD